MPGEEQDHSRSDRDHDRSRNDHDEIVRITTRLTDYLRSHDQIHIREREERVAAFAELQRRLDALNHAHEEARRKEADFQSKEAAEVKESEMGRRVDGMETRLAAQGSRLDRTEGNRAGSADTVARLLATVAAFVGIGTLIAVILLHG